MPRDPNFEGDRISLFDRLQALLDELPGLFSDRVDLLSLEVRSAGISMAQMLLWMVAAAILGVTAWLGLWGGIAMALVVAGWPWQGVVAGVVIVNVLAAFIAVLRARALVPRLGLPLTRRHLRFGVDQPRAAAPDEHGLAPVEMPPPVVSAR